MKKQMQPGVMKTAATTTTTTPPTTTPLQTRRVSQSISHSNSPLQPQPQSHQQSGIVNIDPAIINALPDVTFPKRGYRLNPLDEADPLLLMCGKALASVNNRALTPKELAAIASRKYGWTCQYVVVLSITCILPYTLNPTRLAQSNADVANFLSFSLGAVSRLQLFRHALGHISVGLPYLIPRINPSSRHTNSLLYHQLKIFPVSALNPSKLGIARNEYDCLADLHVYCYFFLAQSTASCKARYILVSSRNRRIQLAFPSPTSGVDATATASGSTRIKAEE